MGGASGRWHSRFDRDREKIKRGQRPSAAWARGASRQWRIQVGQEGGGKGAAVDRGDSRFAICGETLIDLGLFE